MLGEVLTLLHQKREFILNLREKSATVLKTVLEESEVVMLLSALDSALTECEAQIITIEES